MAVKIQNQFGNIDISNEVIATVVGGAATEIFGIVGMASKNQIRDNLNEILKQICKYVFDNTDILRIYAEPFANNRGSSRVLEKAGFQFEGILRSNAVKNGAVIDMKMYSQIK